MELSIVVPFYNEEQNLSILVKDLDDFFSENLYNIVEILFVDDGSIDSSNNIIKSYLPKNYISRLIVLSKNFGSHAAIRAGLTQASGKNIVMISSDLQDPLSVIKDLYDKINEGFDVVIAQRRTIQESIITKFFSKFYAFLIQKYVANNFPERGFDIIMFNNKVKDVLNKNIEANSNFALQILTFGFKQGYIKYDKLQRRHGKTKWSFRKKIKLLIDSFVAFSYAPIRFVTYMGLIFSILGFFWTIYIIIRTLIAGDLAPGWPALVSILLIGFGITNISLGIIAEYLWRTLDASRKRPVFIIDEIVELSE